MAEVEDEEFLSLIAAAEAEALSTAAAAKRRRISATTTTEPNVNTNSTGTVEEGAYVAALKGSKSVTFQQKGYASLGTPNNNNSHRSGSDGDLCFKCGKPGHWSRDCNVNPSNNDSSDFPEKKCGCGLGNCLVRTANTEKNRGRKFYKCPVREENGGCGFFEWCDQSSVTDSVTTRGQSYSVDSSFPELLCPCGFGKCKVLTAKKGNNVGQQFYCCPSNQGSCGFFKWCNDNIPNATFSSSSNSSQNYRSFSGSNIKTQSSGSPCFKCGNTGHWANNCPQSSSQQSAADGVVKYPNSSSCFKCGKPGHWARDCTSNADPRASLKKRK